MHLKQLKLGPKVLEEGTKSEDRSSSYDDHDRAAFDYRLETPQTE